ncbi:phage tail tape measure protein [Mesorhizobium sp.]|uniref:phage tail tape measure protein n=1 Tax=Mesorhizobium sp. TaxID=1871066 RepID=UPI00120C057D|nr:phage tail tape measure protein [Mesorhizobium sp.]TJV19690.1 MAG: phage tail tape measure protein [Mesorhizobium sp.]
MSNRTIEAVMRLTAKLGSMGAFGQLSGKLNQVNQKALAFNKTQGLMARSSMLALNAMRGLVGYQIVRGADALVTNFAGAERRLSRIAINADAGKDKLDDMFRTVDRAAVDYATTQDNVTSGLETLVAAGRDLDDALSFLPAVTATAQAAGAEITDIATTADSIGTNFGIAGDKMQNAFDILVTSGKQGKFELKDMAQYIPSLAPAFAALGYKGEKGLGRLASALQTIRIREGDAGEAATDLQNVLQKMESQQTVKNFAKFHINLPKELANARKEGKDLLDVMIELTEKATKGDLSKIPALFTDLQVQKGMRALVQGKDAFHAFVADLDHVDGSTLRDLGRVLEDNQAKIDRMGASWERMKRQIGGAISDPATSVMDRVSADMDKASYVNRGLDSSGMSFADKWNWRWKNSGIGFMLDPRGEDAMAMRGGWRPKTPVSWASMADSPELPSRRLNVPPSRVDALRSAGQAAAIDLMKPIAAARGPAEAVGHKPTYREAENASMLSYARQASDIADGGRQAGQSIKEAAEAINQAGKEGGNAFAAMLAGMGKQLGTEAGAAFNATARAPQPGPAVRADTGRSGAGLGIGPR